MDENNNVADDAQNVFKSRIGFNLTGAEFVTNYRLSPEVVEALLLVLGPDLASSRKDHALTAKQRLLIGLRSAYRCRSHLVRYCAVGEYRLWPYNSPRLISPHGELLGVSYQLIPRGIIRASEFHNSPPVPNNSPLYAR